MAKPPPPKKPIEARVIDYLARTTDADILSSAAKTLEAENTDQNHEIQRLRLTRGQVAFVLIEYIDHPTHESSRIERMEFVEKLLTWLSKVRSGLLDPELTEENPSLRMKIEAILSSGTLPIVKMDALEMAKQQIVESNKPPTTQKPFFNPKTLEGVTRGAIARSKRSKRRSSHSPPKKMATPQWQEFITEKTIQNEISYALIKNPSIIGVSQRALERLLNSLGTNKDIALFAMLDCLGLKKQIIVDGKIDPREARKILIALTMLNNHPGAQA